MQLINSREAPKLGGVEDHGVNSLSMSASSELEPGPSGYGVGWNPKWVESLGAQRISREAQAMAVGWGGFTGA